MQGLQIVAGFTLAALALFYFVGQADKSSQLIDSLADGYSQVAKTLMARD